MSVKSNVEEIKEQVDDYEMTVSAILALKNFLEYNYNANYFIGRRMTTSENNEIQKNEDVTLDIVAQLNEDYGIVGEVKK